jgi:hypothetical protein
MLGLGAKGGFNEIWKNETKEKFYCQKNSAKEIGCYQGTTGEEPSWGKV